MKRSNSTEDLSNKDKFIKKSTVLCTSCNKRVNHHKSSSFKKHPQLGVLICNDCFDFYGDGKFPQDETGDNYCRWCAQGGKLNGCDFCHNAFCNKCIRCNFGRNEIHRIKDMEWKCYVCNPEPLSQLVSYCDEILNYVKKKNSKSSSNIRKECLSQHPTDNETDGSAKRDKWLNAHLSFTIIVLNKMLKKVIKLKDKNQTMPHTAKSVMKDFSCLLVEHYKTIESVSSDIFERYKGSQAEVQEFASAIQSNSKETSTPCTDSMSHLVSNCTENVIKKNPDSIIASENDTSSNDLEVSDLGISKMTSESTVFMNSSEHERNTVHKTKLADENLLASEHDDSSILNDSVMLSSSEYDSDNTKDIRKDDKSDLKGCTHAKGKDSIHYSKKLKMEGEIVQDIGDGIFRKDNTVNNKQSIINDTTNIIAPKNVQTYKRKIANAGDICLKKKTIETPESVALLVLNEIINKIDRHDSKVTTSVIMQKNVQNNKRKLINSDDICLKKKTNEILECVALSVLNEIINKIESHDEVKCKEMHLANHKTDCADVKTKLLQTDNSKSEQEITETEESKNELRTNEDKFHENNLKEDKSLTNEKARLKLINIISTSSSETSDFESPPPNPVSVQKKQKQKRDSPHNQLSHFPSDSSQSDTRKHHNLTAEKNIDSTLLDCDDPKLKCKVSVIHEPDKNILQESVNITKEDYVIDISDKSQDEDHEKEIENVEKFHPKRENLSSSGDNMEEISIIKTIIGDSIKSISTVDD